MIYIKLFLAFAKIGVFGFGGGMAMLPVIYQSAEQFNLMSADEFSDLVGISQVTPGPIAVNAATYVGYNCAGFLGALSATLGIALPSFIFVLIVCKLIQKFKESTIVNGALEGVRPVVAGLIASAAVFMGKGIFPTDSIAVAIIFAGSLALMGTKKVSPIYIIIIAGVMGAIVSVLK